MLNIKIEKIVFAVLLIVIIIISSSVATEIKMDVLALNQGITPEELIKSEYEGQEYKYVIKDNLMFIVIGNSKEGSIEFRDAYRINSKSGFIYEMPGLLNTGMFKLRTKTIEITDIDIISLIIKEFRSAYYVEFVSYKENNLVFYKNNQIMDCLTLDYASYNEWVTVLNSINEETEIYCFVDGEKYLIINSEEIAKMFQERG